MILMILAPLVGVLGLFCSHSVPGYLPLLATLLAVFCACSGHGLYPAPFPVTGKLNPGRVANVFPGMFTKSTASVTTPAELAEAVGMTYDTYTGKRVSSQKAMRLTAVFGCIRVLAESMGMLPCNLATKSLVTAKQKATSERLHKLLTMKPNDYMTPGSSGSWSLCLCLRGNFMPTRSKRWVKWSSFYPLIRAALTLSLTVSGNRYIRSRSLMVLRMCWVRMISGTSGR